jgi:hypothetical protein
LPAPLLENGFYCVMLCVFNTMRIRICEFIPSYWLSRLRFSG